MGLTVFFFTVEFLLERGYFVALFNRRKVIRVSVYVVLMHMIFLFGSFGNASEFIYFQF